MAKQKVTDTMVEVFNNDTGSASYYSEYSRIKRLWDKPNSMKKIDLEEIKDQMNTKGGSVLFEDSILLIKDNKIREELGLKILPEYLIDDAGATQLLQESADNIKNTLENAPDTIKEKVVAKAIETEIKDVEKMDILKEITGVDVYTVIKENKEEKTIKSNKK